MIDSEKQEPRTKRAATSKHPSSVAYTRITAEQRARIIAEYMAEAKPRQLDALRALVVLAHADARSDADPSPNSLSSSDAEDVNSFLNYGLAAGSTGAAVHAHRQARAQELLCLANPLVSQDGLLAASYALIALASDRASIDRAVAGLRPST